MADDESANASIAAQLHSETNTPVPGAAPLGVDMSKVIPAVRNAFTLGWSLVELSGRILAELGEAEQRGMRVASLWRVSLSRIALVHAQVFATSNTDKTFYAPQAKMPGYLFPEAGDADYTHFSLLNAKGDEEDPLPNFKLYDVTRRAINCLALLYVNPDDSLDGNRIEALQDALRLAIGENVSTFDAKQKITVLVRKFLDAWDGFLRESYYAGGLLPDNDLEVGAYEAGRSMASLSWKITTATLDWERTLPGRTGHKAASADDDPAIIEARQSAADSMVRTDGVRRAWATAFRQESIIRLQHDIVALSSALDAAYQAKQPANAMATSHQPMDLELPSVSIRAIKQGIEFWRRAVEKTLSAVCESGEKPDQASTVDVTEFNSRYAWSERMRLALTKQVIIWQTLITGQQSLRAFSTESIAQKLVNEVWEEIEGNLSTDIRQAMARAELAATQLADEAGEAMKTMLDKAQFLLWPLGILAALVVITVIVLLVIHGSSEQVAGASGTLGVAGVWAALTGWFKWRDLSDCKEQADQTIASKADATRAASASHEAQTQSVVDKLDSVARSFTGDAMTALKNGFGQAQAELDDLNRSVSVAYPLVDSIALERGRLDGGSGTASGAASESDTGPGGVSFLRDIVWTSEERVEEMKAVVRAAFGPVAILAYSASKYTNKQEAGVDGPKQPSDFAGSGSEKEKSGKSGAAAEAGVSN
jgi:hypothetical protein